MKLTSFRVVGFRSVVDSGWIEVEDIGALVGVNEAGKSNLLVALWKLNPAKGGEINPTADYPRKHYHAIRAIPDKEKPVFIQARFALDDELIGTLAGLTGVAKDQLGVAQVERKFNKLYRTTFPEAKVARETARADVIALLQEAEAEISKLEPTATETALHEQMKQAMATAITDVESSVAATITGVALAAVSKKLSAVDPEKAVKRSLIGPRYGMLLDKVASIVEGLSKPHPTSNKEARQAVLAALPGFVYYSHYGNLDSEIYLPYVIRDLEREDLGPKSAAKVRTLKVLFEFVKLSAEEILELGQDVTKKPDRTAPTDEEIAAIAAKKKERDILLQSASTDLTGKFRDWWKQGEYRFRFSADGDHFRIWVSDDKRPEDIELESRSTGLQWFFSFYLVFLVESQGDHEDAVLLLDEPGLGLHPLAQKDLSAFFESLSSTNQIVYSAHSPFLMDSNHLERVHSVFVGDDGTTQVSADLRASEPGSQQAKSVYAVHTALGLTVSDTFLIGCQPVIVEGHSDQLTLSAIKTYLVSKGLLSPPKELVFLPAQGVKGVRAVVSIVAGREEELPIVLLDSDTQGKGLAKKLQADLYNASKDRVQLVGDVTEMDGSEVEDLWPPEFFGNIVTRFLRGPDEDFSDVLKAGNPVVDQVEAYAEKHKIELESPGWKVEIARRAKLKLGTRPDAVADDSPVVVWWKALFEKLIQ